MAPKQTAQRHAEKGVPNSPLGQLYREHIDFIKAKNIVGLQNQYTDDCLLISTFTPDRSPLYIRGRKELEDFFRSRIFALEQLDVEIAQWAEEKDVLMIVENIRATVEGQTSSSSFADNWVLRDGKIAIHFAGMVQYPDGTYPTAQPPATSRSRSSWPGHAVAPGKMTEGAPPARSAKIGSMTTGRKTP